MKANVLDMRRDPRKILDAVARNETVTISDRGKPVARVEPVDSRRKMRASEHPAFGMWADRSEMDDPAAWVRDIRRGRFDDI